MLNTFQRHARNDSEIEERFQNRRSLLQKSCSQLQIEYDAAFQINACREKMMKQHIAYISSPGPNLAVCLVEKAGSTFWMRILQILSGYKKVFNPQEIETFSAYEGGFRTFEEIGFSKVYDILRKSIKVMFVRDPFSRLFSAYLDKFYNPNPPNWKYFGAEIVRSERNGDQVYCGHDVTFAEFVSFTLKWFDMNQCVEPHFSEIFRHCAPCDIDYTYIGKMETIEQDTKYILSKLNQTNRVIFDDFSADAEKNAIADAIDWVFNIREDIEECGVSFHQALLRLWRRLQSRGILSKKDIFPFRPERSETIRKVDLTNTVLQLYISGNAIDRKRNRVEVLLEAYSSVPDSLVSKLQQIFKLDLKLFGYSELPDYIRYGREYSKVKPEFSYLEMTKRLK
ncbi:hypothetical protein ACJMK2_005570 [Sinanodonta woodiana]|uniref:Carbohydrate sulfotransferase n=1 Tax=Sinanodonta woodiana TaxID=1069815 RepID=A0ABD3VTL9_SINWO